MHRFSSNKPIISDERIASERIIVLRRIQKSFVIMLLSFLWFTPAHANDITITNVNLIPANDSAPDLIQFDIAWENSWRYPFSTGINNWDATWVFIKYREVGNTGAAWSHLYLSNTPGEYATGTWGGDGPAGVVIDPALIDPRLDANGALLTPYTPAVNGNPAGRNPVVGAFVYRENVGRGRFAAADIGFAFNPAENGMDLQKLYDFKVFAIEMVYVPQGSYFAGSGGNEEGRFKDGTTENPFRINAAWNAPNASGGRRIGNEDGQLWGSSTSGASTIGPTSDATPLNDNGPTGFSGFYSMKYSITQQQYVDFLNALTRTQQQARFSSTTVGRFMHSTGTQSTPSARNGVRLMSDPGGTVPRVFGNDLNNNNIAGESDDGQWIAMNFLSLMDGAAYLDWAGLRPMTELEYEKAARGPVAPVANEYAWGTAQIAGSPYTLSNAGEANESIAMNYSTTGGNANYGSTRPALTEQQGPLRVGIFATGSSNRIQSGASYWGIMELSGNQWERPVTVGNATGRAFTGLHGDGILNLDGHGNVEAWPGGGANGITGGTGFGARGGSSGTSGIGLVVSHRSSAVSGLTVRQSTFGFRGVRSAGCVNTAAAPTFDTSVSPSANANRWISGNSAADNAWQSVAYGNGLFVAVARDGGTQRVMTSPDGIEWTLRTTPERAWNYVAYGNGTFVAVASFSGTSNYMSSPDGINWTQQTGPNINVNSVVYGNGLFVASATSGDSSVPERIATSPDGITWTARTGPNGGTMRGVGFGNGTFVAVNVTGAVWSSTDGIAWTQRTSAANNQWYSVAYGNGTFVVVGITGNGNRVMTSPDGITWTSRTSAANNEWYDVVFGNGLFVAVAQTGTNNRVMTSPDGITWTSLNAAAENQWRGVGFGDGRFVAVAQSGTGNRAMVFESLAGNVNRYKVNQSGQFLWVVPNDWQIVGGQGTNELKVLGGVSPGIIRVASINACGAGTEAVYE